MTTSSSKQVTIMRLPASGPENKWIEETTNIAVEAPLTIDVEGVDSYTILCSPDDRRPMAVGFMFSEGIIKGIDDIAMLADCLDFTEMMRVRLNNPPKKDTDTPGRNMLVVSSCGMCGSTDMQERIADLPPVGNTLCIDTETINRVMALLNDKQDVFKKTRGTHAILIFDDKGDEVSFAEDIGRHNALDKAIGKILLAGKVAKGTGAVLSGRVSFEMVSKCSLAGIEIILAVSAPTSLALDAALHCGITLCASVRNGGATIFTHPERISRS
ncbi:MAG: formate dehydrogenase accessory sulfurtransferase FdhD [Proteobacteria bacterium]|nr:formate dehydrogenase accessory sulfurtransferase FdhD [Pseudomonadota bacterium]